MSHVYPVRAAPPLSAGPHRVLWWLCTSNPFYVISAGLFLLGLRISFGAQIHAAETWALMSGLASYTLLLAVTACLLVRFGNVWDDVRTVLLLVVLMFLATSVTFDEVLVLDPERGFACSLVGLLFVVSMSEGLLRSIRLRLPAWYRLPYYLILALFFLYPLALSPFVNRPHSEALLWGLFGFASVAALVFLTLLPAIRRGPAYVRDNGSPWRWPLYPWTLFGLLAAAVPARAFLLCWSMHLLDGRNRDQLIFGPYFLVPFGLALAVLLLEGGLASRRRGVLWTALAIPMGLMLLASVGHSSSPIYQEFLDIFRERLGGDPLYLTIFAALGFYAYALLRRVPRAAEALTGMLAVLAFVRPGMGTLTESSPPDPVWIAVAAGLLLGLGIRRRDAWRCLLGAVGLAAASVLALGEEISPPLRGAIAFHLILLAMLVVGAAFKDVNGRWVRALGGIMVLQIWLATLWGDLKATAEIPAWAIWAYPLLLAVLVAAYGWLLRDLFFKVLAAMGMVCWLWAMGWRGYRSLRQVVVGLDHMVISLLVFVVAVLISLGKSGLLTRWLAARGWIVPGPGGVGREREGGDAAQAALPGQPPNS